MIKQLYYCDLCKKRIRSNQKVWFEFDKHYHFNCKHDEQFKDASTLKRFFAT